MPSPSLVSDKQDEIATLKARIHDLETALGLHEDHLGVIFKLPKSLTSLLGLLLHVPNVTPEMIQLRLMIATDAKVAMHRLRLAMQPFHAQLGLLPADHLVQSRRGLGYWLDDATKKKIRALVTPEVTDELDEEAPSIQNAAAA